MNEIINRVLDEIPRKSYANCLDEIIKKFGLRNPEQERHTRVFGREEDVKNMLVSISRGLHQQSYLENRLAQLNLPEEEGNSIRYTLTREVLPRLEDSLARFLSCEQYGYLDYQQEAAHQLYMLKEEARRKVEDVKKSITTPEILLKVFNEEAEEYERKHAKELADTPDLGFESPKNRGILAQAGDLWLFAKNPKKAEAYYLRAGPWEYERAAIRFESAEDEERAVKFWTLAAQKPKGYSDAIHYQAGRRWERVGNILEAINSFEKAIQIYDWQEGSYDLHGDPKPGKSEADSLRQRVAKLKELLASGKSLERNKRKENIEDIFNFPLS